MASKMVPAFLVVVMSFVCESRLHKALAPPPPPHDFWAAVAKRGLCPEGGGDKESSCGYWKKLKYCEPAQGYADFMRETCPASCGVCQARPTAAPKPRTVKVNIRECLKAHNSKRVLHGARPLTWDASLAKKAQAWAVHLANKNKMEHAPWSGTGENLYYAGTSSGRLATCKEAVDAWYGEVADYPFWKPPNSIFDVPGKQIGHFTQVVWKSTRKVGVGIVAIKRGFWTKTYIVARYTPPGNYEGQFKQQVGNSILALK